MNIRRLLVALPCVWAVGAAVACGGDDEPPGVNPDGGVVPDGGASPDGDTDQGSPRITSPASLPALTGGTAAAPVQFAASGQQPIAWSVSEGALPPGMVLDAGSGAYSGTPSAAGSFSFTVTATNGVGTDSKAFVQEVAAPEFDGHVLLTENRLSAFNTTFPQGASEPVALAGVVAGDVLVSIDRRPMNGMLYGIGFNAAAGSVTLYAIHPEAGFVVPVGPAGTFVDAEGGAAPIEGPVFGMDFNPAVDRVRVVTSAGQNFRMNPNDGAVVDGNLSADGVQRDGDINGPATSVDETAYTNSVINNDTITTQYSISATQNQLYVQSPPNGGTMTLPQTLSPAVEGIFGFDIAPGVDAPAVNAPVASGVGFVVARLAGQDHDVLGRVQLESGQLSVVGSFGRSGTLGVALQKPRAAAVVALAADGDRLIRFLADAPQTAATQAISGVTVSEVLVGLDVRPSTGQLFALGINEVANNGTLYRVDPQTGVAVAVGASGGVAFVAVGGATVDLPPASSGYGVAFNPSVDRVRVVTATGLNFRVRPDTGGPVDGNTSATGINPDGALNGAGTSLDGVAYTNGPAPADGVTTEYGLSSVTKALHVVNPPNDGTLLGAIPIVVNGAPLEFSVLNGFDIPLDVTAPSSNAPVTQGAAYAALTVGGATGFYRIDLVSGAATRVGPIGAGTAAVAGITVGRASIR